MVERPLSVTSPSCLSMRRADLTNKIYGLLLPYQSEAISRARKILAEFGHTPPSQAVSSTTVFKLVEELNRFI